jgi:hypothetical protein
MRVNHSSHSSVNLTRPARCISCHLADATEKLKALAVLRARRIGLPAMIASTWLGVPGDRIYLPPERLPSHARDRSR